VRLIVASGVTLAIVVSFGLGVVVGKFVLSPDQPLASAPTNAIMGPVGLDNPLADPEAVPLHRPQRHSPRPARCTGTAANGPK
jgi:hypothetical protein